MFNKWIKIKNKYPANNQLLNNVLLCSECRLIFIAIFRKFIETELLCMLRSMRDVCTDGNSSCRCDAMRWRNYYVSVTAKHITKLVLVKICVQLRQTYELPGNGLLRMRCSSLSSPGHMTHENGMLFASVQHNIVLEDNIFLLVRSTWNWWRWNNIDWVRRMVCHIRNDIHFTWTELWLIGSNYKNSRIIFIIVVCIADSDKLELLRRQWFTNNRRPASSILLLAL